MDENYTGTVSFLSSDPLAVPPPSYTFVAADRGRKGFTATLRTQGDQTITVSDPGNGLIPGTLTMTVTGPQATAVIPTLSDGMKVLLALALALSGLWLSRLKRY